MNNSYSLKRKVDNTFIYPPPKIQKKDGHLLATLAVFASSSKRCASIFDHYLVNHLGTLLSKKDYPSFKVLPIGEKKELYKTCYLKRLVYSSTSLYRTATLINKYELKPFPFLDRINAVIKHAFGGLPGISAKLAFTHATINAEEILTIAPLEEQECFPFVAELLNFWDDNEYPFEFLLNLASYAESIPVSDAADVAETIAYVIDNQFSVEDLQMGIGEIYQCLYMAGNLKGISITWKTLKEQSFPDERIRPIFFTSSPLKWMNKLRKHPDTHVQRLAVYIQALEHLQHTFSGKLSERENRNKEAVAFLNRHKILF